MKKLLFGLVIGTAVLFSACNEEDEIVPASDYAVPDFNVTVESVVTTDAAIEDALESVGYEVDLFSGTSDAIDDLSADATIEDQLKAGMREQYRNRYRLGDMPDVSVDWNNGDFPRTITLDYGDETVLENGRILSGMIEIVVSAPMNTEGATRTVTFTEFTVDGLTVNGTITKEVISVDDGREVSIVRDLTVTYPDGTEVECYAELERTWNQGMGTPFYHGDDVMGITGYATCKDSDGNEYTREIKEQLQKRGGCRYLVSGEVEYSANGLAFGSVNYGDGTCDNVANMNMAQGQKQFRIGERVRENVQNRNQNGQ